MKHKNSFGTIQKRLLLCALMLAFAARAMAQDPGAGKVTLEGQLVCSLCWFEADRGTTLYGTPADIECAKDCAEKGIPPAIAVKSGNDFKLYVIEEGRFKRNKDEWLSYIGKQVQATGRVRERKDKEYMAIDELKVLTPEKGPAQDSPVIGSEVELALRDLFGVEQRLSSYRGKIVVLNFWATWCIPCREEMPDLAAIQNEYAALGVQVVGAAADTIKERAEVLRFIKETRINFPVWLGATTQDMKRFGLGPALPGTAIIARDGKILQFTPGVISQADLKKQLDRLLTQDAVALDREIVAARPAPVEASLVPS
jgi:thiol-disulfide isomerase/thioredoxin